MIPPPDEIGWEEYFRLKIAHNAECSQCDEEPTLQDYERWKMEESHDLP